jgi:hypothetical protein
MPNDENFLPTEKGQTAGHTPEQWVQKRRRVQLPGEGLVDSAEVFSQRYIHA